MCRVKYNLSVNIQKLIFVFYLFCGLLYKYIFKERIFNFLIIFCFFALFLKNPKIQKRLLNKTRNLFFILLIYYLLNSLISFSDKVIENTIELFVPLTFFLAFIYWLNSNRKRLFLWMKSSCLLLNVFYLVTIFATWNQVNGNPIFIKRIWIEHNSFYPDLWCGLFGYNGTPVLTFYVIFMFLYDYTYITKQNYTQFKKNALLIFITVELLISSYISTRNENMAFFIVMPVFLAMFFIYYSINKKSYVVSRSVKNFRIVVVVVIILLFFCEMLYLIKNPFFLWLLDRIRYVAFPSKAIQISGSNERLAILLYAIKNKFGLLFGNGFGSHFWIEEGAFGYLNFGISSIGSFVALGGLMFYVGFCTLYTYLITQILNVRGFFITLVFLLIILLSIYTNIFTSCIPVYWLVSIFAVYRWKDEKTI